MTYTDNERPGLAPVQEIPVRRGEDCDTARVSYTVKTPKGGAF